MKRTVRISSCFSRLKSAGFTLVEVTLAIGIVAFAFIALFGLVPTGLTMFRNSMDTSLSTQIVQQIVDNAQQTDYEALMTQNGKVLTRYFDDQASDLGDGTTGIPRNSIYTVFTMVVSPTILPTGNGGADGTTTNLITLRVKIVKDPSKKAAAIGNPFGTDTKIDGATFVAYVARNQTAESTPAN